MEGKPAPAWVPSTSHAEFQESFWKASRTDQGGGRFPLFTLLVRGDSFCLTGERPVWVGSGPAAFSLPAPEPGPGVVPPPGKQLAAAVGVAKECFPTRLSDPEKAKTNSPESQRLHPAHCLGYSPQPAAGYGSLSGPPCSTLVFSERLGSV